MGLSKILSWGDHGTHNLLWQLHSFSILFKSIYVAQPQGNNNCCHGNYISQILSKKAVLKIKRWQPTHAYYSWPSLINSVQMETRKTFSFSYIYGCPGNTISWILCKVEFFKTGVVDQMVLYVINIVEMWMGVYFV